MRTSNVFCETPATLQHHAGSRVKEEECSHQASGSNAEMRHMPVGRVLPKPSTSICTLYHRYNPHPQRQMRPACSCAHSPASGRTGRVKLCCSTHLEYLPRKHNYKHVSTTAHPLARLRKSHTGTRREKARSLRSNANARNARESQINVQYIFIKDR